MAHFMQPCREREAVSHERLRLLMMVPGAQFLHISSERVCVCVCAPRGQESEIAQPLVATRQHGDHTNGAALIISQWRLVNFRNSHALKTAFRFKSREVNFDLIT